MLQFAQVLMSNNLQATEAPCMNTSAKGLEYLAPISSLIPQLALKKVLSDFKRSQTTHPYASNESRTHCILKTHH